MKTGRWTKVECSPSDTPPILLPGICLHRCHSRPTRFARTRRSVTAWQTPGSLRMSGDAQSGSAFHLLPAVSHKLKTSCQVRRLRGWIMCGMAQGIPVLSVLHWQKTRCSKGQKICGSSSALPAGNHVRWALGVPARSVLHLQKDRCLEGAGKAALELDAACPSLTRFLFHVYSNASCGRQFQTSRRFFGPYKKQRGLRNSRSTPAGTASHPFNPESPGWHCPTSPQPRILRLKLPRIPSTQNLPADTPSCLLIILFYFRPYNLL